MNVKKKKKKIKYFFFLVIFDFSMNSEFCDFRDADRQKRGKLQFLIRRNFFSINARSLIFFLLNSKFKKDSVKSVLKKI